MASALTGIKRLLDGVDAHPRRPHIRPTIHRAMFRYRLMTAPFRLRPDFIIIGAARAGTTSLYDYLCDHPSVAPAMRKEVHFFDENYSRGVAWYRAHFPSIVSKRGAELRGRTYAAGEATPYYLFHPAVPERVSQTIPDVKLIVLLRNPIDRAQSQYQHEVRVGVFENVTLDQAIDRELKMLASGTETIYRHYNSLSKGIYVDQLELWAKAFPRGQMLILRSEDLYEAPHSILPSVLEFLDLPPHRTREYPARHKSDYTNMDPDTRQRLVAFFKPHNERLSEFLNRDMGWDR